jgi:TetR/AcrR family transcriptional repressor of mexJK operon
MIRIGEQFSSLMQDPQVTAMYRLLIGEVNTHPHIAELFYAAGPQATMDILGNFIQQSPQFTLTTKQAKYWSCAFFNLLKGEAHMRSLLGLPFHVNKQQQVEEVAKVTDRILAMIEREQ